MTADQFGWKLAVLLVKYPDAAVRIRRRKQINRWIVRIRVCQRHPNLK